MRRNSTEQTGRTDVNREKRKNKKKQRTLLYAAITVLLVLTVSMLRCMEAESRTRAAMLFDNSMYEEKERSFKEEVTSVLQEYDCQSSGVALTRVVDLDGSRQYKLQIHDRRFSLLDETQKTQLCAALGCLSIQDYDGERLPVEIILSE